MSGSVPGGPPAESAEGSEDSGLPTNIVPRVRLYLAHYHANIAESGPWHYDIVIKTDLESQLPYFSGESVVTLDVKNDTSKLVFNVHKELKIHDIYRSENHVVSFYLP